MLISQRWPIAAPAEKRCARTVRVPYGASSIARIVLERAWPARRLPLDLCLEHLFPELGPRFRRRELCHHHLRALPCLAAADRIQLSREFSAVSFLSASARFTPGNMPR